MKKKDIKNFIKPRNSLEWEQLNETMKKKEQEEKKRKRG